MSWDHVYNLTSTQPNSEEHSTIIVPCSAKHCSAMLHNPTKSSIFDVYVSARDLCLGIQRLLSVIEGSNSHPNDN